MVSFRLNGEQVTVQASSNTPLLWVIRENLGKTGTKFGCGAGLCGACTVEVNGDAVRSCTIPISAVEGANVTTIEGLGSPDSLNAVQQAWIDFQVPQCGYCQSGMIMAATNLLKNNAQPTDHDINDSITNICRCGTYPRIRKAIHAAAASMATDATLVQAGEGNE